MWQNGKEINRLNAEIKHWNTENDELLKELESMEKVFEDDQNQKEMLLNEYKKLMEEEAALELEINKTNG